VAQLRRLLVARLGLLIPARFAQQHAPEWRSSHAQDGIRHNACARRVISGVVRFA